MKNRMSVFHLGVACLAGFTALAGAGLLLSPSKSDAQERIPSDAVIGADRLSEAFRSASNILRPSVVTITSLVEPRQVRMGRGNLDDFFDIPRFGMPDELRDQFDEFRRQQQQEDRPQRNPRKVQSGLGSGVIVSDDGYILTNNHVVARSDELQVELEDGRTFTAEIVGTDPKSDVAVLKIEANNLVAAKLGDSSKMQVGDWVIAVGSPFGLDQTVTAGIISATHRQANILNSGYEDFLQTDAAINPGNSGGPLVNLRGEVIGINTAINSRSGTNAGVGFAIPSNMAGRIVEDLRTQGEVVRGYIGALLGEINAENAEDFQLPVGFIRGVYIDRLEEGGPAARATLKEGDVILRLNGKPVRSTAQLRNAIAMTRPGTKVPLEVFRNGSERQINVITGELRPENLAKMLPNREIEGLGIAVTEMTGEMRRKLDVERGVLVSALDRGGIGFKIGLRPDDVILEVSGNGIMTVADFQEQVEDLDGSYNFLVLRGNQLIKLQATFR